VESSEDYPTDVNSVRMSYCRFVPRNVLTLRLPLSRERATAYVCRDTATGQLVSSVFLLENESGGEEARPRGSAADKAAVGLTPEAQLATMGEDVVRRTSMFGAATTAARVEDTAAAGWTRHKYVGMFGTHPSYQQR
jgi:hypothetical protein